MYIYIFFFLLISLLSLSFCVCLLAFFSSRDLVFISTFMLLSKSKADPAGMRGWEEGLNNGEENARFLGKTQSCAHRLRERGADCSVEFCDQTEILFHWGTVVLVIKLFTRFTIGAKIIFLQTSTNSEHWCEGSPWEVAREEPKVMTKSSK